MSQRRGRHYITNIYVILKTFGHDCTAPLNLCYTNEGTNKTEPYLLSLYSFKTFFLKKNALKYFLLSFTKKYLRAELRSEFNSYRDTMRSFLKTEIEGLGKEIRDEISSLRETTKADMKTIRDELTEKVERLFSMQAEPANIQTGMEQSLSDTSDRLMALENSCQSLAADHKKLQEKCIDLENRSRRQNIRILNIPEGSENNTPTAFVAKFLSKVLGEENFDGPILIDRAHRSLAPKPRKGERPRPIIARLHYYSDKEKIMSLSRSKGKLFFEGAQVHIFPDMSPEVGRQRAAFNQVKAKLRDAGIQYRMFFPAWRLQPMVPKCLSPTHRQWRGLLTAKNHHHGRSIKRKNINLDTCVW
uniref:L1 transposable element RRM domain-containing protein n=1 Tax=Cyprinus carpio TaxID=7962 RepID=A0A8C1MXB6_CYPCA